VIELRHLRYFVVVAEELHFGRAAERLHMAQSPLSQQILQLERHVGAKLIDRPRAVVGLTDAGAVFFEDARDILERVDAAVERVRRAARGETGVLRIGYLSEVTADLLPLGLKVFKDCRPDVTLELREGTTGELLDSLRAGTLDVVFVRSPWHVGDICFERLIDEQLMLASPAGTVPYSSNPTLGELGESRWVLPFRDAARGLRLDIDDAFAAAGISPIVVREASTLTAVLLLVAGGAGYAIVPSSVAELYRVPSVDYRAFAAPSPVTSAGMAWRAADRSVLVEGFLDAVRETARQHPRQPSVRPGPHLTDQRQREGLDAEETVTA
jgi:DNA-binding transcriptional LysR family regulator